MRKLRFAALEPFAEHYRAMSSAVARMPQPELPAGGVSGVPNKLLVGGVSGRFVPAPRGHHPDPDACEAAEIQAETQVSNDLTDNHSGVRDCICADPENCTQPVPGRRCRKRVIYPCGAQHRFPINDCPNMKSVPGDRSMTHEHYACEVCGHRDSLDYDEMR